MGEWSTIADDDSVLLATKTLQKVQKNELSSGNEQALNSLGSGVGFKEGEKLDEARGLFDKITRLFLKEICGDNSYRYLPAMLGDGRCVNLFKLFLVVRENGGYDSVSNHGSWDLVAEESGLGRMVASALKLIYIKYLDVLERWLERLLKDKKSGGGLSNNDTQWNELLTQMGNELNSLLSGIEIEKLDGTVEIDGESKFLTNGNDTGSNNGKEVRSIVEMGGSKKCIADNMHLGISSQCDALAIKKMQNAAEIKSVLESDLAKIIVVDENSMNMDNVVTEAMLSQKRKRASTGEMLNWVIETAKNPFDPAIGVILERSNWDTYHHDLLSKQVQMARDELFFTRDLESTLQQSIWKKKQKMHPSMYEDDIGSDGGSTGKLRYSQRLLSVKTPISHNSPEMLNSVIPSDTDENLDYSSNEGTFIEKLTNMRRKKRIRVGPPYQINIPEWTDVKSESDSKWLGTQIWPITTGEKKSTTKRERRTSKGRQDSCACPLPSSCECVRFHISEKRMRLKLELGSFFYLWKFDKMGEDVKLSWTMEEEKMFKATVKSNSGKPFWNKIFKLFPRKSRQQLVSYYFNVFLLNRRSDQNRSYPYNIDSDDDDSESTAVTNVFGVGVNNSPGSILYSPSKKTHNKPE